MTGTKLVSNLANGAIIILTAVLLFLLIHNYYVSKAKSSFITVGDRIAVPGYDFAASDKTVLVALRSDCHFCQDSTEFYGKLNEYVGSDSTTHVLAVFDDGSLDNEPLLEKIKPRFADVKTVRFQPLNISVTPTIVVTDNSGQVKSVWKGKLSDQKQKEFFVTLQD
jgi:hypothetical protein